LAGSLGKALGGSGSWGTFPPSAMREILAGIDEHVAEPSIAAWMP
jgi:hypothetical protein